MNETMEELETIRKLRFLPREELVRLTTKLYSFDDDKLIKSIKKISGKKIRKPDSFLQKCNPENCIALICEYGSLPEKVTNVIDSLYNEYLYGVNPTIYFSQLILINWKDFEEINSEFPDFIKQNSDALSAENEEKYKNFEALQIFPEKRVIEILFQYQRRIDYVDPETATPSFVYTLEEGIIWLAKDLNALIIKCSEYSVTSFINKLVSEYFTCRVRRFTLHKNVINSVLGKESIRSGNYVNPIPEPNEVKRKSIGDEYLMEKSEGRNTDERYDRTSSFHRITGITNYQTGLNVNSSVGKISLRAHLKKSDIREWSLKTIQQVIGEMATLKKSDIDTYFKGIELGDILALKTVNNSAKEVIRDIIIALNKAKSKGILSISTHYSVEDLYLKAGRFFNFFFIPMCSSCGSISLKCKETGDFGSVLFNGRSLTLTCEACKETITNATGHFECVCGNQFEGDLDENIIAFPTQEFISFINSTVEEIELTYKLEPNEILKFSNGDFEIIPTNYKYLYFFDELPAFRNIPRLEDIDPQIAKTQISNVEQYLQEICKKENYSDHNCRNCLIERKGDCLQRIIAYFTNGELHAHSGVEFGDVSFRQTIDGSSYNIVCLAKSYNEAPIMSGGDRKYTMKKNSGLLNQVVETVFDGRIDFIGIISGADLDPRLKETIVSLVRTQSKKIVFFEKRDIARISSQYFKQ
ncbi:hypothetical protein MSSAC_2408 [Methanosarcina siciliae C2J]|uniref:Uncharacterized protein n=1 Tax=Methanosarcina siciliae C2J TaxID=1434118 RepID=A0A0E3PPS2_9EURY|nr:hypothetical protein [Methanosarcina siciliae]AKB36998.1 hypothetical protein MSSAC_2408 [Methanosarcina siciliae C2J]